MRSDNLLRVSYPDGSVLVQVGTGLRLQSCKVLVLKKKKRGSGVRFLIPFFVFLGLQNPGNPDRVAALLPAATAHVHPAETMYEWGHLYRLYVPPVPQDADGTRYSQISDGSWSVEWAGLPCVLASAGGLSVAPAPGARRFSAVLFSL
jgi:hypothetical protein